MKKFFHKIAIEYPIVTILLVVIMISVLYVISEANTVDKYLTLYGTVQHEDRSGIVNLVCDTDYYNGILKNNKAIWYVNLESAVHTAMIEKVTVVGDQCQLAVKIDENVIKNETNGSDVIVKLSYGKESVFKRLISK